ncbi:phage antirepressor KilAC domain-containing protein, partial [Staphylococcus aureus]|nr:phage antirepressor KilAC domain-containing protein [Staphylococcus aureus]
WLRQNGFLIKRKGVDYNMPTQYSMERELFEIKETSITLGKKLKKSQTKPLVCP